MIPGAILASRPGSGPIANGNKEITIKKTILGLQFQLAGERQALYL
ncbi:hypothetical protein P20480_0767 [Pseudoalteromonas sp. BSi20480]|nr:hypothetical protein P20480_0767 [Pseudoalteromonas sp. BSi20480]